MKFFSATVCGALLTAAFGAGCVLTPEEEGRKEFVRFERQQVEPERLAAIKTAKLVYHVETPSEQNIRVRIWYLAPGHFRIERVSASRTWIACIGGKENWCLDSAAGGVSRMTMEQADEVRLELVHLPLLRRLLLPLRTVTIEDKEETVGGEECRIFDCTPVRALTDRPIRLWVGKKSLLPRQAELVRESKTHLLQYFSCVDCDGVTMAEAIVEIGRTGDRRSQLVSADWNVPLDNETFRLSRPLPEE